MTSNRVAAIVLNYQTWEYTVGCVESLATQTHRELDVYVIDNASPNDSVERLQIAFEERFGVPEVEDGRRRFVLDGGGFLYFWRNPTNGGYADGNNVGIRAARAQNRYQAYWVLNNDTAFGAEVLAQMVEAQSADPFHRPVGNDIYYYDNPEALQMKDGLAFSRWSLNVRYIKDDYAKVEYLSGASFLVDNAYLDRWGLIPDQHFLNCEDWEFFLPYVRRWRKEHGRDGLPYLFVGRILHKESATQTKGSGLSIYYYARNILSTMRTFYPVQYVPMFALLLAKGAVMTLLGRPHGSVFFEAIRDHLKGRTGRREGP